MNPAWAAWRQGGWLAPMLRPVGLPVALLVAVLLAAEFSVRAASVSSMLIVPPSAVWQVLVADWPILLQQAIPTAVETCSGFVLAAGLGVVLGVAVVWSRRARQALYPHIVIFQLIPKIALAPLFVVWFGIGEEARLCFVAFMAFFPMVIATIAGLLSAERNAVRLARSLCATRWQEFLAIRFPFALPHLFAGLKIAVTMAMIGEIVGEFISAQKGLGYIIMFASSGGQTALVFAAIVLLCVIGFTLYGLIAIAEQLVTRRMGVTITSSEF